ncbi:hypothetical protein AGIG_G5339 [Arapaima gigas]
MIPGHMTGVKRYIVDFRTNCGPLRGGEASAWSDRSHRPALTRGARDTVTSAVKSALKFSSERVLSCKIRQDSWTGQKAPPPRTRPQQRHRHRTACE